LYRAKHSKEDSLIGILYVFYTHRMNSRKGFR